MTTLRMKALLLTGMLMTLGLGAKSVNADEYSDAVASAPSALVTNGLFTPGTTGTKNKANVVTFDASGNVVDDGAANADKSLIKITDTKDQVGSIWSTANNKFNLNKDNRVSMWMYFGNQGSMAGDGMAFVLQNDSRVLSAISGGGESLGVWGVDNGGTEATVANTAIKNSWALEFDTHRNGDASKGSGFDNLTNIKGNHLASAYPNQGTSYESHGLINSYNKLGHNGLINTANLSNGKWWHVTVDYKSTSTTAGLMTYTIGDKDPNTGAVLSGASMSSIIDKGKFASVDGQVTWGFTGATGAKWETNLVMFEEISDLVSATATQKVIDTTQNNKDITADGTANGGDKLNFQTTLKYTDGKRDWEKIVAELKTPNNLALDKNGVIKYADGTTQTFDTSTDSGVITESLTKNLSKSNDTATISMTGVAGVVAADTKVTSPSSTFNGQNTLIDSNAASFTIKAFKQNLTIAGLVDQTVDSGQSVKVVANIKTDTLVENNAVTITTKLNDKVLNIKSVLFNKLGNYSYIATLPADKLNIGTNTYTVSVEDQYNNSVTGQETITVKKPGKIELTTVNDLNFGTIAIPSPSASQADRTYSPTMPLEMELEASLPGTWDLSVTGTDMVGEDKTVLKDTLIYKDTATSTGVTLSSGSLSVLSDQAPTDKVTKTWAKDTGVLLRVHNPSEVKSQAYSATVNWTLKNVPAS